MESSKIKLTLHDVYGEKNSLDVTLEFNDIGLTVKVDGYTNNHGQGDIIHMENQAGEFVLRTYEDKDDEEPTRRIDFENAKETP